jgi:flagellar biosynthesis/type III secretory pathway M-ring protein FliF/YscJ
MTLAALQKYYKKVATWCVQHWRWLVFASAALIAYFLGRKNSKSLRAQAESALEQYKKESEMLEKEHKDKKEKLDSANRKYTLALKELDKKYDDDSSKLRRDKDKHYKVLLEKAKKDPEQLDSLLKDMGIAEV